jgi:co-chaperonin GroES (HSP10)
METLTDIIVAQRDPIPDRIGSIIMPQCVMDADRNEVERGVLIGTVQVCGPQCKVLKPGMRIMYNRSQRAEMEHEGVDFSVMHEDQILAVVED